MLPSQDSIFALNKLVQPTSQAFILRTTMYSFFSKTNKPEKPITLLSKEGNNSTPLGWSKYLSNITKMKIPLCKCAYRQELNVKLNTKHLLTWENKNAFLGQFPFNFIFFLFWFTMLLRVKSFSFQQLSVILGVILEAIYSYSIFTFEAFIPDFYHPLMFHNR